jgi:hypothetical protein
MMDMQILSVWWLVACGPNRPAGSVAPIVTLGLSVATPTAAQPQRRGGGAAGQAVPCSAGQPRTLALRPGLSARVACQLNKSEHLDILRHPILNANEGDIRDHALDQQAGQALCLAIVRDHRLEHRPNPALPLSRSLDFGALAVVSASGSQIARAEPCQRGCIWVRGHARTAIGQPFGVALSAPRCT